MQKLIKKINFKQPKYMLPAILYLPLLGCGYLFIDLFNTEVADVQDKNLETTEYLNSKLPQANTQELKGKYDNMLESYGKITDKTAIEDISTDKEKHFEKYDSKYSSNEMAYLDSLAKIQQALVEKGNLQKDLEAAAKQANDELVSYQRDSLFVDPIKRINELLPLVRMGDDAARQELELILGTDIPSFPKKENKEASPKKPSIPTPPSPQDEPKVVTKKKTEESSYFNTLAENEKESSLIKAIIDEDIKAVEGSRVRLRLLDDIEIENAVLKKGSYLYMKVNGFSSQRATGSVNSILLNDEIVKVNLSIYDTDGIEGLYVPESSFRETVKEIGGAAMDNNLDLDSEMGDTRNSFADWGKQTLTNSYQKASQAIGKLIKKNKVKLKYGTFVYLVNGNQNNKNK